MSRSLVHEIRNHLAVAIANVEAFRDGVLAPTPARLDAVLAALTEIDVLVRDLPRGAALAPAPRGEPPGGTPIDVCAVISNEVGSFEAAAAEKGIAFAVLPCEHGEGPCENFAGDPIRIAEIVDNVVASAIRATPSGARIDVDCRRGDGALTIDASEVHVRHEGEDDTRGRFPLVQRFVELHGGRMLIEPSARGVRLTVTLPGTALSPAGG